MLLKCFLMEIIFCWPMKPCQQPSDCVYLAGSASYAAMSARMIFAVYFAMSRPVLNLFWARMRAAYSGLMAFHALPWFSFKPATALMSS